MDFFIEAAMEWKRTGLARELAWCDVLHSKGKPEAALNRLRAILRQETGQHFPQVEDGDAIAAAFVILERLRHVYRPGHPDERAA